MTIHMPQTERCISELLKAAELDLTSAAEPYTQKITDAQIKLRSAIGNFDVCKQAAANAAVDVETLLSAQTQMTSNKLSLADALAGANSRKESSTQALAAATRAVESAQAEAKEAHAPYQAELDLVDGLRSLQTTFGTERTSMEKAVASSAVSQYQSECAQAARDYRKPFEEMTYDERRDSDPCR